MTITIPTELEQFIQREIASGRFRSRDEAISEGVRLLRDRETILDRLRADLQVGIDQLDRGEFVTIGDTAAAESLVDEIATAGHGSH